MGLVRFLARTVVGIFALGVTALIVLPVFAVGIPVLIILAVVGVIGAVGLSSVGIPTLIVAILAIMALAAVVALAGGLISVGVLVLKVVLFAMLLSWVFRKIFGRRPAHEPALVGMPVADIAAPRRDKYDIAAERELDEELGI